jgi:hypothetical protein
MAEQTSRVSITEKNLQKWKMIQVVSLLPLLVSIVLMFMFKGSTVGTVMFFLILIVGIVLPQVCRNVVESHVILLEQIRGLQRQLVAQRTVEK